MKLIWELSKKKAVELDREKWDWLYRHPSKNKEDWPRWKKNGGDLDEVSMDCFACEYVEQFEEEECRLCPFVWPHAACLAPNRKGLYNRWKDAKTHRTRKKYARLIRDLPER